MELPSQLSDKASEFPETSYGATHVVLLLNDNRKIENVVLAWGSDIVRINNVPIEVIEDLGFGSDDIVDVLPS